MITSFADKYPITGTIEIDEIKNLYKTSKNIYKLSVLAPKNDFTEKLIKKKSNLIQYVTKTIYEQNDVFLLDPEFSKLHELKITKSETNDDLMIDHILDESNKEQLPDNKIKLIFKMNTFLYGNVLKVDGTDKKISVYNLIKLGKGAKINITVSCRCTIVTKMPLNANIKPTKEIYITFNGNITNVIPNDDIKVRVGLKRPDYMSNGKHELDQSRIFLSNRFYKSDTIAKNILRIKEQNLPEEEKSCNKVTVNDKYAKWKKIEKK